jgi:hypothetical protein
VVVVVRKRGGWWYAGCVIAVVRGMFGRVR